MLTITIDTDKGIGAQAQAIFEKLGLDVKTAFNLFLHQTVNRRGIPFTLTLEQEAIPDAPKKETSDEPWNDFPLIIPLGEPDYTEEQIRAMQEYEARTGLKAVRPPPQYGSCKGLIHVPDDFDDPIEEMKEYM